MANQQPRITVQDLQEKEAPELIEKIYFWLVHNRNTIYSVLGALVAVSLVVAFVGQRRENTRVEASNALFHAMELYEDGLQRAQWATPERTAKMAEVRETADQLIKDYPGTPAASSALYLKANAYYFEGEDLGQTTKTEQAIKIFQEYLAGLPADAHYERAAAQLALGYASENLHILVGNEPARSLDALKAAASYYDELMKNEQAGFLRYEAMVAMARLLVAQNQPEPAKQLLERVIRERGNFPAEPGPDAKDGERVIFAIQQLTNQFTTANTARIQLIRLGVDADALIKEAAGS